MKVSNEFHCKYRTFFGADEARENARIMLKNGRISVEEIPSFFPKLTLEDAKEIEAEIMQLA